MRRLSALILAPLIALPAFGSEVIVESDSGEEFPAALIWNDPGDGSSAALRATGTGLRKKAWFKVYAACFYVREDADLGEDPYAAFIDGDFEKSITMRFLRDVGADKIMGAFRDGIRKTLPEGSDEAVEAFVGMWTDPATKGKELSIRYRPGQGLSGYQDGRPLGSIDDASVIAAVWATWFGDEPISDDLKKGLAGQ